MSKKCGYTISGICFAIAIMFSFATIIKYNKNNEVVTISEDDIVYYIDGVQTNDISSIDTSNYNVEVVCNNGVTATWEESTKSVVTENLVGGGGVKF